MAKRIIIFILALALLLALAVVPVSADTADTDETPYIELVDYLLSPLDETPIGAFYVSGSYDFAANFSLTLGEISGYGYEITYSYSGNQPTVTGVSLGGVTNPEFTSRYLEDTNLGKVRGNFEGATGSDVGISFTSSGCYITIHSFKVFLVDNFQIPLSASLPDGSVFPGDDMSSLYTYSSILVDGWRNYDFVDLSFTVWTDAVTSVSAVLMDNTSDLEIVIPCEVNYINRDYYQGTEKAVCVTVSCDLRNIDPATTPDSSLVIRITSNSNEGSIQMTSVYGTVFLPTPDEYTPWLKAQVSILMSLDYYAYEIEADTGSINNLLNTYLAEFRQYRTDLETSLDEKFQSLNDTFTSLVTSLQADLDLQFDLLKDYLSALEKAKWETYYQPSFETIFDKFDQLINGPEIPEEDVNNMQQSADKIDDLNSQMQAATPQLSVDDVNVNFDNIVPSGGMVSVGSLASTITSNSIVSTMLMIVASMALIGYVFFGKR